MSSAWIALWIAFSLFGLAAVYATGLRIERWSPVFGLLYLVLLGPAVPIVSWVTADHVMRVEHASCDEPDPGADRLNGMSPSEFRSRCIATQDNSEWLARRRLQVGGVGA